jgi:hypothetical protein
MTTHVFDGENEYLDSDTVLGVKDSLIRWLRAARATGPPGVRFVAETDFALAPAQPGETT